jgi:hypothetical protein
MQKAVALLRSAATAKKSNSCLHRPPLLSHPMTGGPGPASQRRGRWRIGGKAESEPPEPRDGLEKDKNLNRLARTARAGDEPLGDPALWERSSMPFPGGTSCPPGAMLGNWPHLRVHSSSEVGSGASVGTYRQGYLLLGCPGP